MEVLFMSFGHVLIMYPMLLLDCFHLQRTSDSQRIVHQEGALLLMILVENLCFPRQKARPS